MTKDLKIRFITRHPDKAYVGSNLWLPKKHIAEKAIKEGLQYWSMEGKTPTLRKLWSDSRDHIICPREFIRPEQYSDFSFPFIDLSHSNFPQAKFRVKKDPRDDEQRRAYEAMAVSAGGILNLACGKGKTFLSLKRAADIGFPTLVVVHNTFLMNQWVDEAIPNHVELAPKQKVGVIRGKKFDWKHPITVAMIHTLASLVESGNIPIEFREHFGTVIYDEVHHLSAPVFATTADLVSGYRYGLTATQKRLDGSEFVYKYHIGDIFYSDLKQDLIPRIYFQYTPISVDLERKEVLDVKGELNIGKLRSYIGGLESSNKFRAECIQEALDQGRKVLCVSHSKDQLINLNKMFPGSGLVVEETPAEERSAIVKKSKVCFAIARLGFEGLDDDGLDTVFVLLPFKSPNDLQQVMGRVQRKKEGKKTPVVIVFEDINIKPFKAMCGTMKSHLKDWDKHAPGMPPLSYVTVIARK